MALRRYWIAPTVVGFPGTQFNCGIVRRQLEVLGVVVGAWNGESLGVSVIVTRKLRPSTTLASRARRAPRPFAIVNVVDSRTVSVDPGRSLDRIRCTLCPLPVKYSSM